MREYGRGNNWNNSTAKKATTIKGIRSQYKNRRNQINFLHNE